jgi:hypothetical protein
MALTAWPKLVDLRERCAVDGPCLKAGVFWGGIQRPEGLCSLRNWWMGCEWMGHGGVLIEKSINLIIMLVFMINMYYCSVYY